LPKRYLTTALSSGSSRGRLFLADWQYTLPRDIYHPSLPTGFLPDKSTFDTPAGSESSYLKTIF
jgi:hypothetical protein